MKTIAEQFHFQLEVSAEVIELNTCTHAGCPVNRRTHGEWPDLAETAICVRKTAQLSTQLINNDLKEIQNRHTLETDVQRRETR